MVRGSSCGPIACWILARTCSLVTWSLYEMRSILRQHLTSMVCILWSSAVRVHDSKACRKMDVTRNNTAVKTKVGFQHSEVYNVLPFDCSRQLSSQSTVRRYMIYILTSLFGTHQSLTQLLCFRLRTKHGVLSSGFSRWVLFLTF